MAMTDKILGGDGFGVLVNVQDIYKVDTVQRYRLGSRLRRGDRVWKYARAGGTLINHRCCAYYDYGVSGWAVVPTATPAGDTTVYATIGASEGVASDGAVAVHELEGGYVTIFRLQAGADNTDYTFQIVDNNAVESGGGTVTLTIDNPLQYACSVLAYTEITGNPYSDVRMITAGNRMFMGQPMAPAVAGEYLWIQTWGPTWLNPETGAGGDVFGNVNGGQQAVFENNGSVIMHSVEDAAAGPLMKQHAGCVMTRIAGGANTQGTPLFFLQISM